MNYAPSTLAQKLRDLVAKKEKVYGGPTEESELLKQTARMIESGIRNPAPTTVWLYHEHNDASAYGEQILEPYASEEKGLQRLRERVETVYGVPFEELANLDEFKDDPDAMIGPNYVSVMGCKGCSFFVLEKKTVNP